MSALVQHRVDLGVVRGQVGEIDIDSPRVEQLDRVLQRRHHAETQEVHLDDAEVGAVFLVPLDDHAPGHGGGLQGHHMVEPALGDDHAPRVLAEVPRQVLDLAEEAREEPDAAVFPVEARALQPALEGVVRVHVLEPAHGPREALDLLLGELQHLADLPGGAAVAVGDDVRGHGRPRRPVALVDVLDHPLAPIAAREVEVDVGPLPPLLGEEALEEQLHAHGIHGRDAQAVADRAVGGGAAPLHEDALALAEVHEVPDDQEVAAELELADEGELPLDLLPGLVVIGAVASARPLLGPLAEKGERGLARRHRIVGKAVAQVVEGEDEPLRQLLGVAEKVGSIREEGLHRPGRLQVPLGVLAQEAPGGGQRLLLADAGEGVEQGPALRVGVANAVGGHGLEAEGSRPGPAAPGSRLPARAAGAFAHL